MDTIPRQLGAVLDVLGLDWAALFGPENQDAGKNRNTLIGWLYRILDTLDNKTAQLLRFAALLLAAQTFLVGLLVRNQNTPHWISVSVLWFLFFPLLTGVFGLSVFRVKWLFFGKVREKEDEVGDDNKIKVEIEKLAKLCDERVKAHQWTLYMCWGSAAAFALTLIFALSEYY